MEPLRKIVLAKAQHYLEAYRTGAEHVREHGQNHGKMIDHWLAFCNLENPQNGDGYPYCAAFGTTCVGEALGFGVNLSLFETHKRMRDMGILPSASCEEIEQYARRKGIWEPANHPEPNIGWFVLYAFGSNPNHSNHLGIVKSRIGVNRLTGIVTIEANTLSQNTGDQRNPSNGGIFEKRRGLSKIAGYVRIP